MWTGLGVDSVCLSLSHLHNPDACDGEDRQADGQNHPPRHYHPVLCLSVQPHTSASSTFTFHFMAVFITDTITCKAGENVFN